jgi:RNA polymerase sigma-70 factor (ECF subfamily)
MAIGQTGFHTIIETHQRMVFSIAVRICGVYETAEEVAQDVFLELYRSQPVLASEEHLRFWLRRVAVHRATDAWRKRARQPEQTAEPWEEQQHGCPEPSGQSRQVALDARLDDLLRSLPEAQRVAIVLRFTEGMRPEEIAELLGQPIASVKSNLQRGLALLRRKASITMKEYVRARA